ncbi:MAG: hypothetical protein N2C12_13065 [Planctomycetales bacterium]
MSESRFKSTPPHFSLLAMFLVIAAISLFFAAIQSFGLAAIPVFVWAGIPVALVRRPVARWWLLWAGKGLIGNCYSRQG